MVHLANCGYLLQKALVTLPKYCPFAWKCQASHSQLDSCVWLYIWCVMDQSQSCTQCFISHWILEKHLIAIDADVKQVITSWLQTLDNTVFTVQYKPWYHCGANAEMVVVTTLRSDAYHLLDMCHVLVKVTITFWHKCLLTYFVKVHWSLNRWIPKYWVFWMVGFLCHLLIIFTIICSSSDFHPAMPTQFCNLHMSCLKTFSFILHVFVWNA